MDWEVAKEHLYEMKKAYEEIGFAGAFGLSLTINPLVNRYENGERTKELHEEIMEVS